MNREYKIILIEDEDVWVEDLSELLEEQEYKVVCCKSAPEAERYLSKELFHFAVIDLKLINDSYKSLSESDYWGGWKVLKYIKDKSLNSTMGTMVITVHDTPHNYEKAIKQMGAVYYMSKKKFDSNEFIKTIKIYIEDYNKVYFYNGILKDSSLPEYVTNPTESEIFRTAYKSVDGLREYFRNKEKTGIKTIILFSDLCDSTRYKVERGFIDGLFKLYNHNEIVTNILKEYGGIIVKTIGDCVMCRFDTNKQNQGELSTKAINAAIRIHEVFDDKNIGFSKDLEKYKSKTGICIGVTGDNYPGDPHGLIVDIASRLTSLAKPEQILISTDLVETSNISGIQSRAMAPPLRKKQSELIGEYKRHSLKGIEDQVSICEIMWDGTERGIQES